MTRNISLCAKNGSENEEINKNVSTVMVITLLLSLLMATAMGIFYYLIPSVYSHSLTHDQIDYGKTLFLIIGIRSIVAFLIQTLNGAILGFEKYSFQQIVKLVYLLIRTCLVIVLLLIRPLSLTVVIIDTLLTIIEFGIVAYYCFGKLGIVFNFTLFDKRIFKLMLPLAFAMFLQTIVNMANGNVDKFVIGVLMSPEAVSVYSVALFVYTTFSSLTTIPISMYMPQIAQNMKNGLKGQDLTRSLVQPCRLISLIGGLVLFGYLAVGRQFIEIVYGRDYSEAWLLALVIMGPMYINMSNGVLINVLDVMRKRMARSLCLLFTTLANICLTIWWIHTWGMIGAAVATGICTLVGQVFLMNIYYKKVIGINVIWLFKETFRGILLPLVVSCATGYIVTRLFCNVYSQFLSGGVMFVIAFSALYLLFGTNDYEKVTIKHTTDRLLQKTFTH